MRKTSKYTGVCRKDESEAPWEAQIRLNKRKISLGRFENETEAAVAYDVAQIIKYLPEDVKKCIMKHCVLNFHVDLLPDVLSECFLKRRKNK